MSTDFMDGIACGFILYRDEIDAIYEKTLPEVAHTETRYDQITGKQMQARIVDRAAGQYLSVDGVHQFAAGDENGYYDDYEALMHEVVPCDSVPSVVCTGAGDLRNGFDGFPEYVIVGPGDIDVTKLASLDPHEVEKAREDLERLRVKLAALGFDPGTGGLHSYGVVS